MEFSSPSGHFSSAYGTKYEFHKALGGLDRIPLMRIIKSESKMHTQTRTLGQ